MKANLIIEINEITLRDYSLIEEEGILSVLHAYPDIRFVYEEDDDDRVFVLKASVLAPLLKFLSFTAIPVTIIN